MEIADTEEPVSWLKQQPQHNPNRHSITANTKAPPLQTYNKRISAIIQGQEILPRDRRPASPTWSNTDMSSPSTTISPSPTPTTSTSTDASLQKIHPTTATTTPSAHNFLPRLDLDLEPVMMMRPRHNKDEEEGDDDDDDIFSGQSSPTNANGNLYRRIRSLEEQLEDARRQADAYKEQLVQQDRTAQQLVTKYMEEKEKESARVHQLVELVEMQEQLIQALRASISTKETESPVHAELAQLRQDLEALHFEKRSLETRMAAFLHDELDVSKVSLLSNDDDELYTIAALGYRSSSEQARPDGLSSQIDLRRRSSSILDADQYSLMTFGSPRNNTNSPAAERITSLGSATRFTNQSLLNLVEERDEEDDAVSHYSFIASSSPSMSFSSPTSSMSDPRFSYLKSSPLRSSVSSVSSQQQHATSAAAAAANAARKAAWARIMIPPATPPPSHPLPPIPPKDRDSALVDDDNNSEIEENKQHQDYAIPRSHRSCSPHRTRPSPLAIDATTSATSNHSPPTITKHQSMDTFCESPTSSLASAPPVMSLQAAALQASMSNNGSETSQATTASSLNGGVSEDPFAKDRQGFWKGMKKKWMLK